jgi:hypothetical protein
MRNLVFVIWMLGFMLVDAISRSLNPARFSSDLTWTEAVIVLVFWWGIGALLYERKPRPVNASVRGVLQQDRSTPPKEEL